MHSTQLLLLLVVGVALCFKPAAAFNYFDLGVPLLVRTGLTDSLSKAEGFGFSLTQHRLTADGRTVALVGAPRSNSSLGVEVGGVYSCPLMDQASCVLEPGFQNISRGPGTSTETAFEAAFPVPVNDVFLSGQLMGYSLRSFGAQAIACAPLYTHSTSPVTPGDGTSGEVTNSGGRCVVLNNDLTQVEYQLAPLRQGLSGLFLGAGLDSALLNVDGDDFVAVSSPLSGGQTSGGQIFLTFLGLSSGVTLSSASIPAAFLPLTGFHLERGYFTQSSISNMPEQIVSSAPRSEEHFGSIEIYTLSRVAGELERELVIRGPEADGYFGYDFAVVDLLSNGYHSIVVGCPLCGRDKGAIYVYPHSGDPSSPFGSPMVIPSPSLVAGRFGLAVENIGDIDLDGFHDVAVSAPFEGSGVVYIYRGKNGGLVADDFQLVPAVPLSQVFGFTISGGLDIDGNGYPDVTVGGLGDSDLASFKTSPLVNVTAQLQNENTLLDLSDRRCELANGVRLACFNVTPCFHFEAAHGSTIQQFALTFDLEVDALEGRVGLYDLSTGTLGGGVVSDDITLTSPGLPGQYCQTFTFALQAGLTQTSPLLVRVGVSDVATPLALDPATPSSLHPRLLLYASGDELAPTNQDQYEIRFDLSCTEEQDPDVCEPRYNLDITENFPFAVDGLLVIAQDNEFGYVIELTNTAADDGLNPTLNVRLPTGVQLSRYAALSPGSVTDCSDQDEGRVVTCILQNPTLSGASLQLEIFFKFNLSSFSLAATDLSIQFVVLDGFNDIITDDITLPLRLDAVASFQLTTFASQPDYQGFRLSTFHNSSLVPLNETGPLINVQVLVEHTLSNATGSVVPLSTLYLHLPVAVRLARGEIRPLIIPTELLVVSLDANCSHRGAVPANLSMLQEPLNFVPPWDSPLPPSAPPAPPVCADGQFQCGVIICSVRDFGPSPVPGQVTLFARLFSDSVVVRSNLTFQASLVVDSDLPRLDDNSDGDSQTVFEVRPAIVEVQRDCIRYWVVVVSVVIGIVVLVVIIAVLALCGVFKKWYKAKKEEAVYDVNGYDQPDSDFTYRQRTLPPIAGLTNGREGTPQLTYFQPGKPEPVAKETEAASEAAKELEEQLTQDVPFDTSTPITVPPQEEEEGAKLEDFEYDPHEGVGEEGEGLETEL